MSFIETALHPRKYHLHQLPTAKPGQIPDWQGDSTDACVLIPVFGAENTTAIEDYVAKAAAWALRTWKVYSDAFLHRIPCYIYVEDQASDRILPILRDNNVPSNSIMLSGYNGTKEYGKSLAPLFDERLQGYKYLVIPDVDLFVVSSGDPLPFFKALKMTEPKGFGVSDAWQFNAPLITSGAEYWIDRVYYAKGAKEWIPTAEMYPQWLEIVSELANPHTAAKYSEEGSTFAYPFAAMWIVETQSLTDSDRKWIVEACDVIADDEAVVSIWSEMTHKPLWTLKDLDLLIPHYEINEPEFISCFQPTGLETPPCFVHFGNSIEQAFMKGIGCYGS